MTTADKLTYIQGECYGKVCVECKLTPKGACNHKVWNEWTDEEIEIAYNVLTHGGKEPEFVKANPDDAGESEGDKIRTPIARIIIGGSAEKPCYSIQYFDPSDKEFHIGFSSYALNYVQEWFTAYFEIVHEPTCIPYIKPENMAVQNDDAVESDAVHSPSHYTKGGIECIDAIKASMTADGFCDYCKGNVLKYIWRWRDKGGAEDLEKARVYLNWMIEEAKK